MTQAMDEHTMLNRLRGGQDEAFADLFEHHAPAVRRLARSLANDASEAEDITAETFFRVLRAIKRGNGPNDNVRGYLLTVARRVAWEWRGAAHDVPVSDDELTSRAGVSEPAAANSAEYSLITRAFTSLPERWRTVLWRTEVEGAQPAVVAPHFGLSPNATAALARRARQGLRAAYLQAHLGDNAGHNGCRSVLDKLGSYTAGAVTAAEASRISAHLGGCAGCRSTHDELRDVCHSLRANSAAIVLALPAAAGGGFGATVKGVLSGTKVKIGAAIASTAVVGVLGLTAGPAIHDSAVDILGLQGQQGVSGPADPAKDRAAADDLELDEPTLKREHDQRRGKSWGLPQERESSKKASIGSSTNRTVAASDQLGQRLPNSGQQGQQPEGASTLNDLTDGDVSTHSDKEEQDNSKPKGDEDPRTPVEEQTPPDDTEEPPGSKPDNGTDSGGTEPPPESGYDDVAHDCVDDYQSSEYYNAEEGRTETYEYSYQNGEGYETTTYQYDNGDYYSYTYYWQDSC